MKETPEYTIKSIIQVAVTTLDFFNYTLFLLYVIGKEIAKDISLKLSATVTFTMGIKLERFEMKH